MQLFLWVIYALTAINACRRLGLAYALLALPVRVRLDFCPGSDFDVEFMRHGMVLGFCEIDDRCALICPLLGSL